MFYRPKIFLFILKTSKSFDVTNKVFEYMNRIRPMLETGFGITGCKKCLIPLQN